MTYDGELPGMWEEADFLGGSNDIVPGWHIQEDTDPDGDDTRREDEPGDWVIAGFDGECSRGGETFGADVTIRADGDGGWECQGCVSYDEDKAEEWEIYAEATEMRDGAA